MDCDCEACAGINKQRPRVMSHAEQATILHAEVSELLVLVQQLKDMGKYWRTEALRMELECGRWRAKFNSAEWTAADVEHWRDKYQRERKKRLKAAAKQVADSSPKKIPIRLRA